jgi:subtilisin family serine protease
MQSSKLIIISCIILFAACKKDSTTSTTSSSPAAGCTVGINPGSSVIEGRYIVAIGSNSNSRTLSSTEVSRFSSDLLQRNNIRSSALLRSFGGSLAGFVARLSAEEVNRLKTDVNVKMIEPDRIIALGDCFTVVEPRLITWNVNRVGYGDGRGKTAWIIDSGIDFTHPDLDVDTVNSRSFISTEPSANDENGHGTHVAGIIGALNNSIGVLGVASGAKLVSLKVLDKDGKGTAGGIIEALAYVNENAKAGDVVNISSGEDTISNLLDEQVKNTAAKGIFIAIAAGNEAKPAANYSPARANGPNIYTVSAIDSLDNFASFSNYGNDVIDYAAPGVHVVSTWIGGQYARASGTSMAAPHVAGLLLLVGNKIKTSGYAKNDPDGTPDPIAHD